MPLAFKPPEQDKEVFELRSNLPEIISDVADPGSENPIVSIMFAVIAGTTSWTSNKSISFRFIFDFSKDLFRQFAVELNSNKLSLE